ncbi:MAG: hypothetical protein AB7P03_00740 [Kofleriaceae bacterium]
MKTTLLPRSRLCYFGLAVALAACGSSGGGGGGGGGGGDDDDETPDAPKVAIVDAPAGIVGLGQKCNQANPCMGDTPVCLTFKEGSDGICSKTCVESASFMTDGMAIPGPFTPNPTTQNGACQAVFSGSVGAAVCGVPHSLMPNETLKPNKPYTVAFACGISCGAGDACPTGLTCNSAGGPKLCVP